jgi:uncharacterized protein YbaR (Trm112 family)
LGPSALEDPTVPALAEEAINRITPDEGHHKTASKEGGFMTISKELLEILACPQCKGDIRLNERQDGLICEKCRLVYEIKDGIPIMLIEEAKPWNEGGQGSR